MLFVKSELSPLSQFSLLDMFSLDGTGRGWNRHTEVPLEGRASTCYTDMLEMEPGEIFLVFGSSYTKSWRREEVDVRLARVSVRRE